MDIKLSMPNMKFLPLMLLFLSFNLAPLALITTKYVDYANLNSSINELVISVAIFLIMYGINYLIGSYYFSGQSQPLKSEVTQSILHLFTISRTGIILICLSIIVFIFCIKYQIILLILLGLEVLLFLIHYIGKKAKS